MKIWEQCCITFRHRMSLLLGTSQVTHNRFSDLLKVKTGTLTICFRSQYNMGYSESMGIWNSVCANTKLCIKCMSKQMILWNKGTKVWFHPAITCQKSLKSIRSVNGKLKWHFHIGFFKLFITTWPELFQHLQTVEISHKTFFSLCSNSLVSPLSQGCKL